MLKRSFYIALFIGVCGIFVGCYSFRVSSVPATMKTVSVQFFENNAPLVVPYLSQNFTEALKQRIRNQSRLGVVRNEDDANFEGRIVDYNIRPASIQGERAVLNRFTITVNVKYSNTVKPSDNFEQSFTRYIDFDIS